jgi:hypothetical protein
MAERKHRRPKNLDAARGFVRRLPSGIVVGRAIEEKPSGLTL